MHANELLDVIFRWAHLIAGIMWIGNSMLFNWLDRNLIKPGPGASALSQGKIYMVHSGAFYEVEKKLLEPGQLPDQLHWFKWQNFSTWATGICLLIVVYYMNGAAFLIDPSVRPMSQAEAIGWSVGSLVAAWAVYDALWMTVGRKAPVVATALSFALLFGASYAFTLLFSGRASYLQTGVMIGTVMTGNVWMRIMPSQKSLIAATKAGQAQDATLSLRAKQRSIHNNYLTFPLLFIMISNHFPSTYGHHLRWFVLLAVMVGGAGVRHFMNVRYDGKAWLAPGIGMAAVAIAGLMVLTRIREAPAVTVTDQVGFARVQEIVQARCVQCHSARPTDDQFPVAPNNVMFDTAERVQAMAARIKDRVYVNKTMPFLNKTGITETERAELAAWVDQGAKLQ
ncbi:MAG: urate hydroxylase PuuD [Kofleriaceae bacterium]